MILNISETKTTCSSEPLRDRASDEEGMLDEVSGVEIRAWVPVFRVQGKAEASPERTGEALITGVGKGAGIEDKRQAKGGVGGQGILPRVLTLKIPHGQKH